MARDAESLEPVERPQTVRERRLALFGRSALEAAGFKRRDLRNALAATRRNLTATRVQRIAVSQGKDSPTVVEEFVDQDGPTQLRAAEQIYRLADALPRASSDKSFDNARVPFVIEIVKENLDGTRTGVKVVMGGPPAEPLSPADEDEPLIEGDPQ